MEGAFTRVTQMLSKIPKEQLLDLWDYMQEVTIKILGDPSHEVFEQMQVAFTKGDVKGMEAVFDAYERALIERDNTSKREGIEVGKEVGKRETAKKMLELGAEKEFIIKATGLSASEVEELING